MKTTLRAVALCLLLSHARGFAVDFSKMATDAANAAIPTLAAFWIACRVLDVAHYIADAAGDNVNKTAGNAIGKVVDFVDPRVTLQQVLGCAKK